MKLRLPTAAALALAATTFAAPALRASDPNALEIARVWTAYRDAKSFVRLSEYFTGKENTGDAIVLRSQPERRDGFYFTVRLAEHGHGAVPDGRVVLQVIAPDQEKPREFAFPFTTTGQRSVRLDVGVTGADWPHGKTLPLAWKIEIFAADGRLLAQRESFLWAKPASAKP